MATYKTPGVYIEEIPKFPPSVAEVETAIPAFFGYTQKAFDEAGAITKPKRIESLLEYELYFGTGPNVTVNEVKLDSNNNFKSADVSVDKFLYDTISLFYKNGGGVCYIVSTGSYNATPSKAQFLSGLSLLEKVDEPTILVFADIDSLSAGDSFDVYQQALAQCTKLGDRVAIFGIDPNAAGRGIDEFRDNIGVNSLKYGAAYTPYLLVSSPKTLRYADVKNGIFVGSTQVSDLSNLTSDTAVKNKIKAIDDLAADLVSVNTATTNLATPAFGTLADKYEDLKTQLKQASSNYASKLTPIFLFLNNIADAANKFVKASPALHNKGLVDGVIEFGLNSPFENLTKLSALAGGNVTGARATSILNVASAANEGDIVQVFVDGNKIAELEVLINETDPEDVATNLASAIAAGTSGFSATSTDDDVTVQAPLYSGSAANNFSLTVQGVENIVTAPFTGGVNSYIGITSFTAVAPTFTDSASSKWDTGAYTLPGNLDDVGTNFTYPSTDKQKADFILSKLDVHANAVISAYNSISTAIDANTQAGEIELASVFPVYKAIIDGVNSTAVALPPVGAVAGLYAFVDDTRGVWKAPANVSVNGIVGVTEQFSNSELEELNVHPGSGKSINAIRPFTGKGTLVFGARTLAGNDNEWRYVSVRRFFNMVEESVKKASEQFVFEPNDANTWVKMQGMIENYLTQQWRAGALAGAKAEQAFYVSVGLGKTMTSIDVLEGRMNVEIGMAVVRPAEFIVLKFSHKMQEA